MHEKRILNAELSSALFTFSCYQHIHDTYIVRKIPDKTLPLLSMRPQINRPDVSELSNRIEKAIESLPAKPRLVSHQASRQLRCLQTIFVKGYQALINMSGSITYSDWAGYAMVLVTKCGGVIIGTDLMGELFDVIYSLHCGYAGGAFLALEARAKFSPKYKISTTTYKDVYDIATDFNTSFGALNEIFNYYKDNLETDVVVDQICPSDVLVETKPHGYPRLKPHRSAEIDRQTIEYICSYLWNAVRINYFKLKYLGLEKWDYDEVFQYEKPPFPEYVFLDFLGRFEENCRWLPVGEVGIFSNENVSLYDQGSLQGPLNTLDDLVTDSGVSKAAWQCRLMYVKSHTDINLPSPFTEPRFAGSRGKVDVGDETQFDPAEEVFKMGKLSNYPREAAEYVGEELHRHRLLHHPFFNKLSTVPYNTDAHSIRHDLPVRGEELFNSSELSEEMYSKVKGKLYSLVNFTFLFEGDFRMAPFCETGKFVKPTMSPITEDARRMQETKEFMFFRRILESETNDTHGGLFIQSCIDFCNRFDPPVEKKKGEWADWKVVSNMEHPKAFINDKNLFVSTVKAEDQKCTLKGQSYNVTASGSVCYGYNPQGEPLVAPAMFCEGMAHNILSQDCFKNIRGALYKDPHTGMVKLPILTIRNEKVVWKGHEITNFEKEYWHERFNHMNVVNLKRYAQVIAGMPPYFWPFTLKCSECPRHTEIEMEEEEE